MKVADEIRRMKSDIGKFPKLAFVLVGDRRDSHTFIHLKSKACEKVGIETVVSQLPENCTENELLDVVSGLNDDQDVHGIIVQLPLPQVIYSSFLNLLNCYYFCYLTKWLDSSGL